MFSYYINEQFSRLPWDNKWKHRCEDQVGECKPEWTKQEAHKRSTKNLLPCMVLQVHPVKQDISKYRTTVLL
jgi:hypothetical protein